MSPSHSADYLTGLARELCKLPSETEWVDFKINNADPKSIGEYISALANTEALSGKDFEYLIWGVENETHNIVGSSFAPTAIKVGNEALESWLLRLLTPKIHFRFFKVESKRVVFLEIERAHRQPVQFHEQRRKYVPFWAETGRGASTEETR